MMRFELMKKSAHSAEFLATAGPSHFPGGQPEAGLLGRFIGWIRQRATLACVTDRMPKVPQRIPPVPRPTPIPAPVQLSPHPYAGMGSGYSDLEPELSNLCRLWRNGQTPAVRLGAQQRIMELLIPTAGRLAVKYRHAAIGLSREDLQQEALLSLCGALETYNPRHQVPFSAFARRRMHGAILDALRRWSRRSATATAICADRNDASAVAAVETADLVKQLLAALPAPQRRVVELHFVAQMPRSGIAGLLGVHVSRVGQLLREAMAALRTQPHTDSMCC